MMPFARLWRTPDIPLRRFDEYQMKQQRNPPATTGCGGFLKKCKMKLPDRIGVIRKNQENKGEEICVK